MEYTPLWFLSALGVSCSHRLFSISVALSLSATSHLLAHVGASLSHSPGSSYSSLSLCDGTERMIFSSKRRMSGHQLGCCRGFVQPEASHPPPPHPFFRVMSYSWRDSPSFPRWQCGLSSVCRTDAAQIKVRGQQSVSGCQCSMGPGN